LTYSDFTKLEFDSYIVQQEDHQINTFRLLDTDNRIVLHINSPIRIFVTAADVLHSWTVPRLGVKTEATPGRLNQVRFSVSRPGYLYGQCSEICGANHRFMPIVIERVSTNQFINWISKIREPVYSAQKTAKSYDIGILHGYMFPSFFGPNSGQCT